LANRTETIVAEISLKLAEQLGYEFVDCEYKKFGTENTLTVFVDKEGGVNLDDCEVFSRKLEEILDEKDPISSEYILSVSSPGLDRPIKTQKDFERNIGKKIYIKLYRALDKRKEIIAVLNGYDDETINITDKNNAIVLKKSDVAMLKQHVEF